MGDWRKKLEHADGEVSVDLLALHGGQQSRLGSLKELGCKLDHPRLRELPYPFDAVLSHEQMVEVAEYNRNDLEITAKAALVCEDTIAQRVEISIETRTRVINKHNAGLAEAIMAKALFGVLSPTRPTKTAWHISGEDLVKDFDLFTHPELVALRERIRQWDLNMHVVETIEKGETKRSIEGAYFAEAVKVGETSYTIGHGGLHSVDDAAVYDADARHTIKYFDIRSAYPSIIINYEIVPGHLPKKAFLKAFTAIRQRRLDFKDAGRDTLSAAYKVANNSLFGKFGNAYGWLTDPPCLIRVTLGGQLLLLQFINLLDELGAEVLSANTDGCFIRVRRERADMVQTACNDFAALLGFGLDWREYRRIARRAINDYMAFPADGGKPTTKGAYNYDPHDLTKKATNRICILAAQRFFGDGTPVADTVRACRDLCMFVNYFKCSHGYRLMDGEGNDLGTIQRWYLGKDTGVHIDKVKDGAKTQVVDYGAVVVPDLPNEFPADVDYDRYVAMAEKLVTDITDPDIAVSSTIPLSELSKVQHAALKRNFDTLDPAPEHCLQDELQRAHSDYTARYKGHAYGSMKSLLVRLWLAHNGRLTRGDLLWIADQLDEADGYFAGNERRTLTRMVDWVCRSISPFRLPQNTTEVVERAITWAVEHVEPCKRKRKMFHKDLFASTYINGDALRRYGKTGDVFRLACSICAAGVKHGVSPDSAFIEGIIADVGAYFSKQEIQANE